MHKKYVYKYNYFIILVVTGIFWGVDSIWSNDVFPKISSFATLRDLAACSKAAVAAKESLVGLTLCHCFHGKIMTCDEKKCLEKWTNKANYI